MDNARRHRIYNALIKHCLDLSVRDLDALRAAYGFTAAEVRASGARSMPSEIKKLVGVSALARIANLEGVAGFYKDGERWRLNLHYRTGLLIPYRDKQNRILGLQIYKQPRDPRPVLLTSRGLKCGAKATPLPKA